jgi:hypothetical protein
MTVTLTSLSEHQWGRVGKVILWLIISAVLAGVTAWIAKDKNYLATLPAWNVLGVLVTQILNEEETSAVSKLPASLEPTADKIDTEVATVLPEIVKPTVEAPVTAPVVTTNVETAAPVQS